MRDASALTLRSYLGFQSPEYSGFSMKVEVEDSRVIGGVDDFSVPVTQFNAGEFSVIEVSIV